MNPFSLNNNYESRYLPLIESMKSNQLSLISDTSNHIIYPSPFLIENKENNNNIIYQHYQCKFCLKRFEFHKDLICHQLKHENKPLPFQCKTCFKQFAKKSRLKKHEIKRHPFNVSKPSKTSKTSKYKKKSNKKSNKKSKPSKCNTKYRNVSESNQSKSSKSSKPLKQSKESDQSKQSKQSNQSKSTNQLMPILNLYYCSICDKMIKYKLRHKHCSSKNI